MNARNRVFLILGVLTLGSLIWYLMTTRTSGDLMLMGTVDANEVEVSARIPGLIQKLNVNEGDRVTAGELVAVIESKDLQAAANAAQANVASDRAHLSATVVTERQNRGETSSAVGSAEAQARAAEAAYSQAKANLAHQDADTRRTVALAKHGIESEQAKDDAVTSLAATKAAAETARENVVAAEAALKQARAHELLTEASAKTVAQTRGEMQNAQALANQAEVELGYANVYAPVTGTVNVLAARQGEVLPSGGTIATIMDLSQTWVYAPLPETEADAVKLGDELRVVMPSGATVEGKVIAKDAEADFATQRDINGGRKRDIRTVQIKLLIPNKEEQFVPGMTAQVFIPKSKLVKQ